MNEGNLIITNTKIQNFSFSSDYQLIQIETASISGSNYRSNILTINNSTISNIKCAGDGTVIYATLNNGGLIELIEVTFTNCISERSGGAIWATLYGESKIQLNNSNTFRNCMCANSEVGHGGAFYLILSDSGSKFITSGQVEFMNCTSACNGGAIWTEINAGELSLSNINIENCYGTSGGAIYLILNGDGQATIDGSSSISNCNSPTSGGGIYINSTFSIFHIIRCKIIISGQLEVQNCCSRTFGGGIYAEVSDVDITLSGLKITDCQSGEGGGIYLVVTQQGIMTFSGLNLIQNCSSTDGSGGGIYICNNTYFSQLTVSGSLTIKDCNSQTTGGGIYVDIQQTEFTFSGINIDNSLSKLGGGGLNSSLSAGGRLTIQDSSVVQNCRSIYGSGGALYSFIDNGKLSLDSVSFMNCSCSQPYNGGALYIALFSATSNVSITNSSFKQCQTNSSSSQKYGWGGAIFIHINYSLSDLDVARFNLTKLVFEENLATGMGQNIHIQSNDTLATGSMISSNSLLTVNDTTNLYTSPFYAYDYMGIDNSDEANYRGTNSYDKHHPLFKQSFISTFINPSYIDANNGLDDLKYCGRIRFSCKRISYVLNSGTVLLANINFMLILLSDSTSDSNLQVNIPTKYCNYITIQSDGYTQDSQINANPKYQIPTSSQSNSLFTITDNGHLDLLGLRFSNLNPTSQNPLFSVQSPNLDNIPILSIIGCEFNQDPISYPVGSLSHCLIFINGGKLTISKTIIKDYYLSNRKSSIMIQSDKSSTSEMFRNNQIEIINSTFENIKQVDEQGSGACVYAELKAESLLNISQSCSFTNCISRTIGGAIQSVIQGGHIELNEVIIKGCKARNGGGIYVNIDFTAQFEFKVINSQIQNCQAKDDDLQTKPTGFGGGIFVTGSGDYDPSTESLDLKGMKIFGNSADKAGQSLYVVMTNLIEWCREGIAGEYVKGNYNDRYSKFEDIEGISVNLTLFNSLSQEQIQQQQQALQYYWVII
ncbi:MAG: hypothetical protein EZS28_022206 [Streblomastix strix]|uniref:Uncharacterized protein n=1 Tax=Streblomastix strix TaxID=222440 RepID=A0A5J4VI56_9EUKA|nr:MAG: hypothetical protein EZS28_022206 [Streblomastix strix]